MIELYHNDMSTCAQKARLALAHKRLAWTGHHLDLRAGAAVEPAYLALNPAGVVPTLVEDGRVVVESNVILEYLEDAHPAPPLRPADPHDRARLRLWLRRLDDGVHAATGTISFCIAHRHHHARQPRELLERYLARIPDRTRREHVRTAIALGPESPHFPGAVRRIDRWLGEIETALGERPWLAGEAYSLADLAATPYLLRLAHLQLEALVERRPRTLAWAERLVAQPGYAEGIERWLDPAVVAAMAEHGAAASPAVRAQLRA